MPTTHVAGLKNAIDMTIGAWLERLIVAAELGDILMIADEIVISDYKLARIDYCACNDINVGASGDEYWMLRHAIEARLKENLYTTLALNNLLEPLGLELKRRAAELSGDDACIRRAYLKHIRTRFLDRMSPDIGYFVPKH